MLEAALGDPVMRFLAQVIAILAVSRVLGLLSRRVGQPMVVAEIAAGILLGPSLLGWLAPEVGAQLFAPGSLDVLHAVSQLGLVLFMFLVGLDLDPRLLRGQRHTPFLASQASVVVPFALGALLALHLHPRFSDASFSLGTFALFIGAAMSITAFPVLARILGERRLLRTRLGAITIACAALDDVSAFCLVAFVAAAARAADVGSAALTVFYAVVYIAAMVWIVRPLLTRFAARAARRRGPTHDVLAIVVLLLLASSAITELIGIHSFVGAFVFGAILPKEDGGFAHALSEKLEDLSVVVLMPLFFAYSGVRTHVGLVDSAAEWGTVGLILLVACAGKLGGGAVAARLTGLSWRESGALGVLLNTRGLMALIVLNVGLDLGVLSPTLFTMMILVALATTIMTSPLLDIIYPTERATRDLLAAHEPPKEREEARPPYTILVCVGEEVAGPGLLAVAHALRGGVDAGVHALHLSPPEDRIDLSYAAGHREAGDAVPGLDALLARAEEIELPVKPISFVSASPTDDICNVARVKSADLVVLGGGERALTRHDRGRASEAASDVGSDVVALIDRGLRAVDRAVVLLDGGPEDALLVDLGRRLCDAGVSVTFVVPAAAAGATRLGAVEARGARVVRAEDPVAAAVGQVTSGNDVIVVGAAASRNGPNAGPLRGAPASLILARAGRREERAPVGRRATAVGTA